MKYIKTITIDISKKIYETIETKSKDTARYLLFKILDNGVPLDLTSKTVRAYSSANKFNNLVVVSAKDGLCELKLTTEFLGAPGLIHVELTIYEGLETLSSMVFCINNMACLRDDAAIEATNEFSALTVALNKVEVLDKNLNMASTDLEKKYTERLNGIDAQLEEIKNQKQGYYIPKEKIQIPKELNISVPISIRKVGIGYYETNIEPENFYPTIGGKTYYVDMVNGVSSNDGLTLKTAFKSISTALSKEDAETIMLKGGWYNKDQHPNPVKNIKIKAIEGEEVIFGADSPVVWEQYNGATYKATRSLTIGVWDISNKNNVGEFIKMDKKNNVDEVITSSNSWYFDNLTNEVYVHTFDNRLPDSDIKVTPNVQPFAITSGCSVYLEGIKCYFGAGTTLQANSTSVYPNFYAKNCEFSYSDNANGLIANGVKLVILKGCESSHNYKDGFSYHESYKVNGEFIEINCIGRDNGRDNAGNNNGSTAHESYKGVRIGGQYDSNEGPNVADVNLAKSLNVGCTAYNSVSVSSLKRDFVCDGGTMWLDNCYAKDSEYSVSAPTGEIKVRNSMLMGLSGGTITTYS